MRPSVGDVHAESKKDEQQNPSMPEVLAGCVLVCASLTGATSLSNAAACAQALPASLGKVPTKRKLRLYRGLAPAKVHAQQTGARARDSCRRYGQLGCKLRRSILDEI